ncbi:MAG: hypothetical protein ACLTE4_12100 [Christensenellaceae bacterium]|jgi:hypothetical protein
MKKLKREIKRENEELISKNQDFLEKELYAIVEVNRKKRKESRKRNFLTLLPSFGALAICVLLIGIIPWQNSEEGYENVYETRLSTLTEINHELERTHVSGDFGSIKLMYERNKNTPIYFTLRYAKEEELISYTEVTIDILIDREYYKADLEGYPKQTEYLGYTLFYREREVTDEDVYSYRIEAYMETEEERYMIDYTEHTTEKEVHFEEYLKQTISKK